MEEVLNRLKKLCKDSILLYYIQQGDIVLFNVPVPIRSTRRWQLFQKRAAGRVVPDEDYDSALPLDKPLAGNWKWTPKQIQLYQEQVLPTFRELQKLCSAPATEPKEKEEDENGEEKKCSFLVILQSPLDPERRDVLVHGEEEVDKCALRISQLKDGDHMEVHYRKETGVGVYVVTHSAQLRQCVQHHFNGVAQSDGSVLVKKVKPKVIDAQVKCWQRAISNGARPVVFRPASTSKRQKLDEQDSKLN